MNGDLRCWSIGAPRRGSGAGQGHIALTAAGLTASTDLPGPVVAFHNAMSASLPRATDRVDIHVPTYRGKSFVPVLAWLAAAKLAGPGTEVVWYADKQQGPDSMLKLLGSLGWQLRQVRRGRLRELTGQAPDQACLPEPRELTTEIGGARLRLAADYGVFSPMEVDAGTRLLLDVALRGPATDALADIGTGYAPLAIGLLANGIAQRAVSTDVDGIALWLAERNAAVNGIMTIERTCSADPCAVEQTPLTVCNIPTHINAAETALLMSGLLRRARHGRLLTVVHASLESRYARYFTEAGVRLARHPGMHHVVLDSRA